MVFIILLESLKLVLKLVPFHEIILENLSLMDPTSGHRRLSAAVVAVPTSNQGAERDLGRLAFHH